MTDYLFRLTNSRIEDIYFITRPMNEHSDRVICFNEVVWVEADGNYPHPSDRRTLCVCNHKHRAGGSTSQSVTGRCVYQNQSQYHYQFALAIPAGCQPTVSCLKFHTVHGGQDLQGRFQQAHILVPNAEGWQMMSPYSCALWCFKCAGMHLTHKNCTNTHRPLPLPPVSLQTADSEKPEQSRNQI